MQPGDRIGLVGRNDAGKTTSLTMLAAEGIPHTGGQPGHEIEHPPAAVILGGLLASTLLNLVVTPALYLRFGGPRRERAAAEQSGPQLSCDTQASPACSDRACSSPDPRASRSPARPPPFSRRPRAV